MGRGREKRHGRTEVVQGRTEEVKLVKEIEKDEKSHKHIDVWF